MESNNFTYKYLKFVSFSKLTNWSVQYIINDTFSYNKKYPLIKIGDFLTRNKTPIEIQDSEKYKRVTIKVNNGGVHLRDIEKGINIGTKKQFIITAGQFLLSKIDARNGAFGVVPVEINNAIITGNFWTFDVDYSKINPYYLSLIVTTPEFINFCQNASNGTTNRHYLQEKLFLEVKIPLPSLEEQNCLVENYAKKIKLADKQEQEARKMEEKIENYLLEELGIEKQTEEKQRLGKLIFVHFKDIKEWGIDKILNRTINSFSSHYEVVSLSTSSNLYIDVFRGKSPKYSENSTKYILNQKCNRWNSIEIEHARKVDESWINSVKDIFLTKEQDILINSTGEGTIGRASYITKNFSGLLYDSHILLLRVNNKLIDPLYFIYFFNSFLGQEQVNEIKSAQSTKQTELGINNLMKINFSLPPLEKQKEIVEHITSLKDKIKKLHILAKKNREGAIQEFEKEIFNS